MSKAKYKAVECESFEKITRPSGNQYYECKVKGKSEAVYYPVSVSRVSKGKLTVLISYLDGD